VELCKPRPPEGHWQADAGVDRRDTERVSPARSSVCPGLPRPHKRFLENPFPSIFYHAEALVVGAGSSSGKDTGLFSSSQCTEYNQLPIQRVPGGISSGVKRLGREDDQSPLCIVEVNFDGAILYRQLRHMT
jgi:hypothetical protein